jgi:hypothetical protein
MKKFLTAAAALAPVAGAAFVPASAATLGPRASSENNWPGMTLSTGPAYTTGTVTAAPNSRGSAYATGHMTPVPGSGEYPGADLHSQGGS